MTNLVNKAQLLAALTNVSDGLDCMGALNRAVDEACGNTHLRDFENGARQVLKSVVAGIQEGLYDAALENVLDEAALTRYSEGEDSDTEDMDDLAPEEEPIVGVVMLPPGIPPEEMEKLVRWYNSKGGGIVEL